MSNFIARTSRYECGSITGDIVDLDWYKYIYPYRLFNTGLPNCTTYAYGRTMELNTILNNYGAWNNISSNYNTYWWNRTGSHYPNASGWYGSGDNIWDKGATPKVGAIACWDENGLGGHVAVVESINADGSVNLSESHYGGAIFNYITYQYLVAGSYDRRIGSNFLGYIYNPYIDDAPSGLKKYLTYFTAIRKKRRLKSNEIKYTL